VSALDQWWFEADGGDWPDVLQRAGWNDVVSRARRRAPRHAILAAAALLAVAGPALALVTRTIGADGKGRGPQLIATLHGGDGVTGTFAASVPRTWLTAPRPGLRLPWTFVRTKHGLRFTPTLTLRWRLDLLGTTQAVTSLRLHRGNGSRILTLCEPCTPSTAGRAHIRLKRATFLFNGLATVRADVDGKTLSGHLVLKRR
jgi:hypothetical protein